MKKIDVLYDDLLGEEYKVMVASIQKYLNLDFFTLISELIYQKIIPPENEIILNQRIYDTLHFEVSTGKFKRSHGDKEADTGYIDPDSYNRDPSFSDWQLRLGTQRVAIILNHHKDGYRPHQRFLIDKILTDAKHVKSTDVHIEPGQDPVTREITYYVKRRKGIYMEDVSHIYNLQPQDVEDILIDMTKTRSRQAHVSNALITEVSINFTLTDPLYLLRCKAAQTATGKALIIRLLPSDNPFTIEQLRFEPELNDLLKAMTRTPSGLTIASGVIGSGKGTTINAMAIDIARDGLFSMMSVDSPIEYIGEYPQMEYYSHQQLYEICNAIKKMDRNFVLMNEIATRETALEVSNLVVSGVHVMTTLHNNRLYNIMYKLEEQLGDVYTNIIPFLNLLMYQDKYSNVCKHCEKATIDKEGFSGDELLLLEHLKLSTIKQPVGCEKCDNGIDYVGIQVLTEYLFFSSKIKKELLQTDIHRQADVLQKAMEGKSDLETIIARKLVNGEILIREVISKLDTWRKD